MKNDENFLQFSSEGVIELHFFMITNHIHHVYSKSVIVTLKERNYENVER